MTSAEALARSLDLLHAAIDRATRRAALERERAWLAVEQADLALLTTEDPGGVRWPAGLAERLLELDERRAEIDATLIRLDTR